MNLSDRDWRDDAACLDEDPELFFPIGTTGPAVQQIEDAKDVCADCPVIGTCLAYALDTGQDHGVWGGTADEERRALKRQQAKARRARMVAAAETPAWATTAPGHQDARAGAVIA